MHRAFGNKKQGEYFDRVGAYLVPIKNDEVGVVQTRKGYFLLGGGVDEGETDAQCICRECMEEVGYSAVIEKKICSAEAYCEHPTIGLFHPIQVYYCGHLIEKVKEPTETGHVLIWFKYEDIKGKMFSEMQNWALEQAWKDR